MVSFNKVSMDYLLPKLLHSHLLLSCDSWAWQGLGVPGGLWVLRGN